MEEKKQSLSIVMNGVTFNGPMFDIHDNEVVNNNFTAAPQREEKLAPSDEKIKEAILTMLEEADETGKRIFTEQAQWYAVYRVLSQNEYGFPSKMSDFCVVMQNMGMGDVKPKCDYESIRKVPSEISQAPGKVSLWPNFLSRATEKFKKQIIVAKRLIELLEE